MSILLRAAQTSDAAAITRLTGQLGYDLTTAETGHLLDLLQQNGWDLVLVAEERAQVLGWMQVSAMTRLESGTFGEITGLVVAESQRSRGIGGMLVAAALQWCREQGVTRLKVRSNTRRSRAHRFYLEAGFREVKEQKVFELLISPAGA